MKICASASSPTLQATASTSPVPSATSSACAPANSVASRAQIASFAPCRASCRAITRPRPREPPVMSATLPANLKEGKARRTSVAAPSAPRANAHLLEEDMPSRSGRDHQGARHEGETLRTPRREVDRDARASDFEHLASSERPVAYFSDRRAAGRPVACSPPRAAWGRALRQPGEPDGARSRGALFPRAASAHPRRGPCAGSCRAPPARRRLPGSAAAGAAAPAQRS